MIRKNILILGAALLTAAPALSATPDDNNDDGAKQTLTVNEKTEVRIVSEIRIDGNNAVLLFTDGSKLTADMRLVTLTMSYDEATGINEVNEVKEVLPSGQAQAENDNSWYTLDGRKLSLQPKRKGIYIQSGKKVVNK